MLYQLSDFRMHRFLSASGESRIRTYEDEVSRFTVCPSWPLWYLPDSKNVFPPFSGRVVMEPMEGFEPPTS